MHSFQKSWQIETLQQRQWPQRELAIKKVYNGVGEEVRCGNDNVRCG